VSKKLNPLTNCVRGLGDRFARASRGLFPRVVTSNLADAYSQPIGRYRLMANYTAIVYGCDWLTRVISGKPQTPKIKELRTDSSGLRLSVAC